MVNVRTQKKASFELTAWAGLLAEAAVMAYQMLCRGLLPPACRYKPSCSDYMLLCLAKHGPLRGIRLGAKRLLTCHPFHPAHPVNEISQIHGA